ncbi:MAG TPA: CsgG/HfaB family protein [Spirochaetota bacterium]|nr:CsgG/HfaB family protein [Spirochaetota bacterium]
MKIRTLLKTIFLSIIVAGCGGTELVIKDNYVFSPASHLKNKYPTTAALTGQYTSKKIILKDNILEICKAELDSQKIFKEVGIKGTAGYDVVIEMNFADVEKDKQLGLELSINLKQLPEKKLIYKNKYVEYTTPEAFQSPDGFAEVLKKVITQFTSDMDRLFEKFTKEGNLPVNLSGKNVICAVFQFKDTIEGEKYGDPLASMMMTSLTKTSNIKVAERERIQKAIKELEFQTSGLSDSSTAKEIGKFLNADFLVYGEVSKIKETYHVTIHVIDVKLGEVVLSRDIDSNDPSQFSKLMQEQANYIAQFISK